MIRLLRVARRGALKARVAAAEQLYGWYVAPRGATPAAARPQDQGAGWRLRRAAARAPTSPTAATKATLRSLTRRWPQLQAELDQLDLQLQALVTSAAPTLVALPGGRRDRRPAAGHRRRHPQRLRSRPPSRTWRCRPHPGVLGPYRPPSAQPWR